MYSISLSAFLWMVWTHRLILHVFFLLLQLTFFVILIFTSLERLCHVRGFDELLDWSFLFFSRAFARSAIALLVGF
jgi:hypothetical protein